MVNHHGRKKRLQEASMALEAAMEATEVILEAVAEEESAGEALVIDEPKEPVEGMTFPDPDAE
jgi:hypothetical protein